MASQKLRAGVIGCRLGAWHAYAYANSPEFEFVAACDIAPQIFDFFYERSGVTRGSIMEYTDHREMLQKERLDVVSIATPDEIHAGPFCDASNAGVKAIFCEKPIATELRDADLMIATARRNGTRVSIDHTRSWAPNFQAARRAIRAGEIGGLARIVAHMGGPRSMIFRNGTHLVDAVCYFADAEPVWVIATHERGWEDYGPQYKGQGGKDPALDPASTVIVEFANGVRGILNSAKAIPQIFEFDLQGPNGRYCLTDGGGAAWKTEKPSGVASPAPVPWGEFTSGELGNRLIPAVQELARMVGNDAPSSSPPERALHTLEIIQASLLSQSRGSIKVALPLVREPAARV